MNHTALDEPGTTDTQGDPRQPWFIYLVAAFFALGIGAALMGVPTCLSSLVPGQPRRRTRPRHSRIRRRCHAHPLRGWGGRLKKLAVGGVARGRTTPPMHPTSSGAPGHGRTSGAGYGRAAVGVQEAARPPHQPALAAATASAHRHMTHCEHGRPSVWRVCQRIGGPVGAEPDAHRPQVAYPSSEMRLI
jgi:hypothetical protein